MRSNKKILVGLAAAGLVAASSSAFTAGNSMETNETVGYGSTTTSGVTVGNVAYNVDAGDASLLDNIVFTVDEDVTGTGYDRILTVNGPENTQIDCTASFTEDGNPAVVTGEGRITCDTSTPTTNVADVESIALTVTTI